MSDIKDRAKQLQFDVAKLLSNNLKIPVIVIDGNMIDKILEDIKKDESITRLYSDEELRDEVSEFYTKISVFPPKDEDATKKRITEFLGSLLKEKEYSAILIFEGLIDLPVSKKIGNFEFIAPDTSREKLNEHLKYLKTKKRINLENSSWAKLNFKSYRTKKVREILYNELELPLGFLSLIMRRDLDSRNLLGAIFSSQGTIYFLESVEEVNGCSKYHTMYTEYLDIFSEILKADKKTQIQKKIINSIKTFCLSRLSQKVENRFVFTISALESLLLSGKDDDNYYIGLKLSEKVAFLLGDNPEKRLKIFKFMKKSYNERSELIHDGENNISSEDLATIDNMFENVFLKVLKLSKSYDQISPKSKDNEKEGLDDYLTKIKFNIS